MCRYPAATRLKGNPWPPSPWWAVPLVNKLTPVRMKCWRETCARSWQIGGAQRLWNSGACCAYAGTHGCVYRHPLLYIMVLHTSPPLFVAKRIPYAQPRQHAPYGMHSERELRREEATSPLNGLYVCGDHTDTGTMNGAIRSGRRAAEQLLKA